MLLAWGEPLMSMQNNENGYVTVMLKYMQETVKIASLKAHFRVGVGTKK
jgi:hypothetical protein